MSPCRNISAANGYTANTTTNSDTPPYVKIAPTKTIASIARCGPRIRMTAETIARAKPDSSMSFPNTAPSKKIGKYNFTNPTILSMNNPV